MDWRYNTIWFDQLQQDLIFEQDFKDKTAKGNFNEADYALISHLKQRVKPFEDLPSSQKLLYLDLDWANIRDFQGVDKFSALKRLELHYCIKLENDNGIESLSDTLESLHINSSNKFKLSDKLLHLKKLKVLCLNACGQIDNLKFLSNFPYLIDFRFVDTNILDGNLTPILEHPTIRTVGFLNKKHYNLTDTQLKHELIKKTGREYKKIVYKGQFETFRYEFAN